MIEKSKQLDALLRFETISNGTTRSRRKFLNNLTPRGMNDDNGSQNGSFK